MDADYYRVLGLSRDATSEEIREAYFIAARNYHPDVNPDSHARDHFLVIQEAYEILSHPERRSEYDKTLPASPTAQVQVSTYLSRKSVWRSSEAQLIYLLLDIATTTQPDLSALPQKHIALVIDRSTSMQGERMDMVKASALKLIKQLKPQDWISVVVFSDRAEVLIPPMRANEIHKFDARINLIRTSGSTELAHGLELGLDQLFLVRGVKTVKQLILLTDGHTYGDESACMALTERAINSGVTINVMGIGHEWNDEFLDELSSKTGGNAQFIRNARDLQRFLEEKINNLNQIYAKSLQLDYNLRPEVQLGYVFRIQPESSPLVSQNNLLLGDLFYNTNVKILLEFKISEIPRDRNELVLLNGKLWFDLVEGTDSRARVVLNLKVPIENAPDSTPPPAVILDAMSQISMYRLQEKARREVGEGKVESATRHLQYLATNLLSKGDRNLAHAVLLEAENIRSSQSFSQDGEKRIKYGTRALLLGPGLEQK